jgi:hypothetical protein
LDGTDRLAIDTREPPDLALARTRVQQSRYGRSLMWLQDVQSSFPLVFEGLKVTSCLDVTEALKRG